MSFILSLQEKHKNDMFNDWINDNIEPNKKNKDVVCEMLGEISSILNYYGYKIKDTKQFKNELASYIYSESK